MDGQTAYLARKMRVDEYARENICAALVVPAV